MLNLKPRDYRCPYCGRLFFKGNILIGQLEVKCRNCRVIVVMVEPAGGRPKNIIFALYHKYFKTQ